jgi:glycosyltransferase involved in cell wall biosynthesis
MQYDDGTSGRHPSHRLHVSRAPGSGVAHPTGVASITNARVAFHQDTPVLTIAIPVRNEAPTIGVLLWRVRAVFQEYPREFEVLVFNDGSTDATAEVLVPYTSALPLTVLGGSQPVGYARAVDTLLREAARRTRYPRRDAVILMQGDFTDQPEHIPELVRRFEGGADIVCAERPIDRAMPAAERRLRRVARWVLKRTLASTASEDPFGTFKLIRLSTVRDLIKVRGDAPLIAAAGWAGNLELLQAARAAARRVEMVPLPARYDLRMRESRRRVISDTVDLMRTARRVRASAALAPRPAPRIA